MGLLLFQPKGGKQKNTTIPAAGRGHHSLSLRACIIRKARTPGYEPGSETKSMLILLPDEIL